MNADFIIKNYPKENYRAIFDRKSGFFARIENKGHSDPFWAQSGPELLDISITNWCDRNCSFCYRNSNTNGLHMSLEDYEFLIKEAASINVFQVALGGGNPNQHPEFIKILDITRNKYGIVPSFTTNGRGLTKEILYAVHEYCGAVAVSAYKPYNELNNILKKLLEFEIKTNIHFLLDHYSIDTAIQWLKSDQDFLKYCNAIIFLNYKTVGKKKNLDLLLKKSSKLYDLFKTIDENVFPFKIGFDSCSVSGLLKYMKAPNLTYIEPCEAGRFSAFISEDLNVYPCSFMTECSKGVSLKGKSLINIWRDSSIFTDIREKLSSNRCPQCIHQKFCMNGCPFLSEINLCNHC